MDFFRNLSTFKISVIVVVAVITGMYFYDPPTTECDIQVAAIRGPLNKNFIKNSLDGGQYKNSSTELMRFCVKSNSSGGCQKFFERMRYFEKTLSSLPQDCSMSPAVDRFEIWYQRSIHLMVLLAWGESGPRSDLNSQKGGWLTVREQALYCRLMDQYEWLYGSEKKLNLQIQVLQSLAKDREEKPGDIKEKTLLKLDCDLLRSSNSS